VKLRTKLDIITNRAKHNLKIHLILVCKYRKKLLINDIDKNIKNIIKKIEANSDSHFRDGN